MVLNAAARLVVGVGRYEHVTLALCDVLHWFPVPQRIQFKLTISAFDCVHEHCPASEHCPAYFNNVCIPVAVISGRANFRLAEHHDMLVPSTRTQLGGRSFRVATRAIWNVLLPHLFTQTYGRTPLRTTVVECIVLHYILH